MVAPQMAHQPAPPPMVAKQPAPPPAAPSGPRFYAVYDYAAADDDEISFNEGRHFFNYLLVLVKGTVCIV